MTFKNVIFQTWKVTEFDNLLVLQSHEKLTLCWIDYKLQMSRQGQLMSDKDK